MSRTPRSVGAATAPTEAGPPRAEVLAGLLHDLGPGLCRGGTPADPSASCPTGLFAIDHLLGGGIRRGTLTEITGPPSSGRTSLALALLAEATRSGEVVAVVDGVDAFDPLSAHSAGVDLPRVLWVRAPGRREALRSTERLLQAHGFAVVCLDFAVQPWNRPNAPGNEALPPPHAWSRLARAAASTNTALLLLGSERLTGTAATVALEMEITESRFTGTPPLLETVESQARLARNRRGPEGIVSIRLRLIP